MSNVFLLSTVTLSANICFSCETLLLCHSNVKCLSALCCATFCQCLFVLLDEGAKKYGKGKESNCSDLKTTQSHDFGLFRVIFWIKIWQKKSRQICNFFSVSILVMLQHHHQLQPHFHHHNHQHLGVGYSRQTCCWC